MAADRPVASTSTSSAPSSRPCATASWAVTVAVHDGRDVVAVWPGFHDRAYGIAIDVGSTTIAGHLAEPRDRRRHGLGRGDEPPDPVRRGPHEPRLVRDAPPDGGAAEMTRAVREALAEPDRRARWRPPASSGATSWRSCSSATRSCTTWCWGSTRCPLGAAPFALATDRAVRTTAAALDLPLATRHARLRPAVHRRPRRRGHGGRHPGR